jgi:hypothetical protein
MKCPTDTVVDASELRASTCNGQQAFEKSLCYDRMYMNIRDADAPCVRNRRSIDCRAVIWTNNGIKLRTYTPHASYDDRLRIRHLHDVAHASERYATMTKKYDPIDMRSDEYRSRVIERVAIACDNDPDRIRRSCCSGSVAS